MGNKKPLPVATYHVVDYVDLYETRAVRNTTGGSYGKKGARVYSSQSRSHQEWTNLGRGQLILDGDKVYFTGSGQSRTIDKKKIINVVYFTGNAGVEVSVSNRQKSMRFMLPGRTVEDGQRLANGILSGNTEVILSHLTKPPKSGCYIATYVYNDYNASEVLVLRDFRDNFLLKNFFGKLFVKFYYNVSPVLIKYCRSNIFKKSSKAILDRMVSKLNKDDT